MEPNDQFNTPSFSTAATSLKATFFGKVMFFFGLAILMSMAGVWFSMMYLFEYFIANPSLIWVAFAAELVLIFTSRMWSKKRPLGYVLFGVFALLTGVTITPLLIVVSATSGLAVVVKALLATFLTFTATAIIGYTTQKNLANLGGFLFVGLIGMIITAVVGIFIPWGSTFEMVYSGIGVLLFAGYTMYDFQRIKSYPEDRYIDAALHIYLDIFNLFIFILRLMSAGDR